MKYKHRAFEQIESEMNICSCWISIFALFFVSFFFALFIILSHPLSISLFYSLLFQVFSFSFLYTIIYFNFFFFFFFVTVWKLFFHLLNISFHWICVPIFNILYIFISRCLIIEIPIQCRVQTIHIIFFSFFQIDHSKVNIFIFFFFLLSSNKRQIE